MRKILNGPCRLLFIKNLSKSKEKIIKIVRKASSVWSLIFFFICILGILSLIITAGVSLALKSQGKRAYQQKSYVTSLEKFETAHKWWLIEKIVPRFKDNDLYTQLNKARVMVRSYSAYEKGVEAFNADNYVEAKNLLSQIVINDSNYQDAQIKLAECQEQLKPTAIPTSVPKTSLSSASVNSTVANVNINGENGVVRAVLNQYWYDSSTYKYTFNANVTVTNIGMDETATLSSLCNQFYLTDGSHNFSTGVGIVGGKMPLANKGETVTYTIRSGTNDPTHKVVSVGCGPDSSLKLNIPQ